MAEQDHLNFYKVTSLHTEVKLNNNKYFVSGDLIDPIISLNTNVRKTPQLLKKHILPHIIKLWSPLTAKMAAMGAVKSSEIWTLLERLDQYIEAYLAEWDELGVDVVISPGFGCAAPLKMDPVDILPAFSYLSVHNLTDLPAGILPVTKVNAKDQEQMSKNYPSDANLAQDAVYKKVKKTMEDAEGTSGWGANIWKTFPGRKSSSSYD